VTEQLLVSVKQLRPMQLIQCTGEQFIIMGTTYWGVMPCGLAEVHQHFRETQCLHPQVERASQARKQPTCLLLLSAFLPG
jgi:hypothetical protein